MGSLLTAPPPAEAAAPVSAPGNPTIAPDPDSAAAQARRSGLRVEVASARTELTQVFANPSGGFTAESAVLPQRVRRADGSWADVDLSLRPIDGTLRPAASVADVRFSAGGRGAAVTLVRDGRSLTLSWPADLPKPTVSGDSATYPEVLPGTDLVLRATRTGFTHVLAVKSAQAAANPALRTLRFDLGGDARVVPGRDGRLSAVAGGEVLAKAEPAVMWDSNTTPTAAARTALAAEGGARPGPSTAAAPGDVAKTAAVGVEVAGRQLVLRPDTGLLAKAAAYPVYIDPAWSTGKSRWAYATNNNSNNTDTSVARVGKDPESGKIYRSYFDFPLSSMRGKHIESAYVQMKLDHSWSCGNTPTYMYHSGGIASTPRTAWAPMLNSLKSTAQSHANEGYGCSDSPQPDMTVNFTGSAVTSIVQTHATNNWTNITLGFCACSATDGSGESTTDRWKKWFPANAKLVVDYDSIPGAPNNLQIAGVACPTGQRITVGTLNPRLSAIFPDADTTQALRTGYEWLQIPATGGYNDSTPRKTTPTGASVPANGRSTTGSLAGLVEGGSYAFRARATDPSPYDRTSAWSAWCEFTVDTRVPPVTVTLSGPASLLPGTGAPFQISTPDTTVTKFRYGWTSPTTEVTASRYCATSTNGPVCSMRAELTLVVPKYGLNTLQVSATDGAGNVGRGSVEFTAARPSPAVARWGLESYPGVSQAKAVEDGQPALAGDTPLTATNVGWPADGRLVGGRTATFGGTASPGYLSTAAPVVDTSKSYSVATWVRLTGLPTQNMAIATQSGSCAYGFFFGTVQVAGVPRWTVTTRGNDCGTAPYTQLLAPTAITAADVDRWQQLAFSYDATARTLSLFVNGKVVASTPWTTAWNAPGNFQIGRNYTMSTGVSDNYLRGALADVQVFDRVLVGQDFTGQRKEDPNSGGVDEPGILEPIRVGDWNFDYATGCYLDPTAPGADPTQCTAPESGQFGRRFALTLGTEAGSDARSFLRFDGHHPDDVNQLTTEYGRSQQDTGSGVWQDTQVLRTDDSFSVAVWVRPESLGMQTAVAQIGNQNSAFYLSQRTKTVDGVTGNWWAFSVFGVDTTPQNDNSALAMMMSRQLNDQDDVSTWTHLVGVYDLGRRQIRLYVNGQLESTVPFPSTFTGAFNATGPVWVGAARHTPPGSSPQIADRWDGDISNLGLYQGALTDVDVKQVFESQSLTDVTPTD
ncbi:LamG domain-containing protein [Micromonospora mirobrigensis]|uniref:Concanavalin A-like lectin/glucanases superfamily protein n=1 Tax=Micromonospora mirobrigensis TaxID=262898 RepID=A0A1C4ZZ40_9ACTN|nr:LamG domain-containing protein [Micromonospora mirobrigensis]SCF38203.1 Concanavalin A-like lectin/glucanases superfamily protein [Micromonospora mirobrigensis]